jgi:hypothetical protein
MTHPTTFFSKLNDGLGADVDVQVAPIVNYLTYLHVVPVSSCQGDPGPIETEGGFYGHVAFTPENPEDYGKLCELMFEHLRPMFAHMYDDVRLEITLSEGLVNRDFSAHPAFIGWLRFRNECIDEITKRLGCWVEMLHK